jgi:hypothetical protein
MQYAHDLAVSAAGVARVADVQSLGAFVTTRASLQSLQGTDGNLGIRLVTRYTTSFTQGLSTAGQGTARKRFSPPSNLPCGTIGEELVGTSGDRAR